MAQLNDVATKIEAVPPDLYLSEILPRLTGLMEEHKAQFYEFLVDLTIPCKEHIVYFESLCLTHYLALSGADNKY